jgi:hypothetical protein
LAHTGITRSAQQTGLAVFRIGERPEVSFATPASVASGKPFVVLLVADHPPVDLTDFVEAADFTVDMDGAVYRVQGSGRQTGDEVRFHEKDLDNSGKDIRVWQVVRHEDGHFNAQHAASF